MDQELKDYLNQMERRLSGEIQQTRGQVDKHGEELRRQGEELRRQGEELRRQGEELRRHGEELHKQGEEIHKHGEEIHKQGEEIRLTRVLLEKQHDNIRQVAEGVMGNSETLDSFRKEVSMEIEQVRSLISPLYKDLDRRVKLLESWKERKDRDPVELVRERFGKPKD